MIRNMFLRGHALLAISAIVALASCARSPTAPTPAPSIVSVSMSSVTPTAPFRSDTTQILTFGGLGFLPGLVLRITDPGGLSTTVATVDIRNVLPTSFQASVLLPAAGRYLIVVQQLNGDTSSSFAVDVRNAPASTAAPRIDSVSPSQTVVDGLPQQVSLIGTNFDASLTVHIIAPDGALTEKSLSDLTIEADSVIRFTMVFSRTGIYFFSLWDRSGQVSNVGEVFVR